MRRLSFNESMAIAGALAALAAVAIPVAVSEAAGTTHPIWSNPWGAAGLGLGGLAVLFIAKALISRIAGGRALNDSAGESADGPGSTRENRTLKAHVRALVGRARAQCRARMAVSAR